MRKIITSFIISIVIFNYTVLYGQEKETANKDSRDKAIKLLKESISKYKSLNSYEHNEIITLELNMKEGQKHSEQITGYLAISKPNKFAYRIPEMEFICDGRNIFAYLAMKKQYILRPAPAILTEESLNEIFPVGNISPILANLIAKDPLRIYERIEKLSYDGTVKQGDEEFEKISFNIPNGEGLILIGKADKLFHTQKLILNIPNSPVSSMTVDYKDIKTNEEIPDSKFTFNIPEEGAEKVDSFFSTKQANHPLIDKMFPENKVYTLKEGEEKSVYDLLGKELTFVSFWATWCPPCKQEQPALERIYNQYKDKGVNVIGINVEGKAEKDKIEGFLKENNITFPILIDKDNILSQQLMITGIPALFIIDNSGKILEVHIGFNPQSEKEYIGIIEKYRSKTAAEKSTEPHKEK